MTSRSDRKTLAQLAATITPEQLEDWRVWHEGAVDLKGLGLEEEPAGQVVYRLADIAETLEDPPLDREVTEGLARVLDLLALIHAPKVARQWLAMAFAPCGNLMVEHPLGMIDAGRADDVVAWLSALPEVASELRTP